MDNEPAPRPLTSHESAALLAARAWSGGLSETFWESFTPELHASMRWAWQSMAPITAAEARARLAEEHRAQARPDLARIHVSGWIQALEHEPRSVQRALAARLPAGVAGAIREGLGIAPGELTPSHPADPVATRTALSLWTVRLVGDVPERADDPPVIVALAHLDATAIARLVHHAGLAKWALADKPFPSAERKEQEKLAWFRDELRDTDPRFIQVARREVSELPQETPSTLGRLGLNTFARLLTAAEPYRAHWALQHLAYPMARSLRVLMGPGNRRAPMLARWEGEVLRAAWRRLLQDGWIRLAWRETP